MTEYCHHVVTVSNSGYLGFAVRTLTVLVNFTPMMILSNSIFFFSEWKMKVFCELC